MDDDDEVTGSISLCCITAGPIHRVAAIASIYRSFVDEIVIAVNAQFSDDELYALSSIADRVIRCEMGGDFLQERYRVWLYGQCSGAWIVSTDTDEVPSLGLLRSLRVLASTREVVTYSTSCRWIYPDVSRYLDEYPWEPAWKLVMVRNDPATLFIKGGVHQGVVLVAPYRYLDLPIYHLDCVVTPIEQRKAKVAFYDGLEGVQTMEDGRPISEVYYLPELHSRFPQGAVPVEDQANILAVLGADVSNDRVLDRDSGSDRRGPLPADAVSYREVLEYWPEHPFAADAYRATVSIRPRSRTPHRDPGRFIAGEIRPLMISVRNEGSETWLRDGRNDIWIASRWSLDNDAPSSVAVEGPRFPFSANVHPGDEFLQEISVVAPDQPGKYCLLVDVVHENVRWFDCGVRTSIEVTV